MRPTVKRSRLPKKSRMSSTIRHPITRLLADSRPQWGWITLSLLLLAVAGVIQSGIAWLFGQMTDEAIAGHTEKLLRLVGPMLILLLADVIRNIATYTTVAVTSEKMFLPLRTRVFHAISRMEMSSLREHLNSGDVITRVNGDLSALCEQFAGVYTWYIRVLIRAIVSFVACVLLSWQLSLSYFLVLPLSIWLLKHTSAPITQKQRSSSEQTGQAMNVANDLLHNVMTAKSYNLYDVMNQRFRIASQNSVEARIDMERTGIKLTAIKYISTILPLTIMLAVGALLVVGGRITPGNVIAFTAMSAYVREAIDLSDGMAFALRRSKSLAERIYDILDLPIEEGGLLIEPDDTSTICSIRHLSFTYPSGTQVFSDLNLEIQRGERIGVVGSSGCGKSTLLRLLSRLYLPDEGDCILFGHDVRDWSPKALRDQISLITQEPFLFDKTILDNLRYVAPDADMATIERVLRDACLWEFVESLPEHVNTALGEEGVRLSGGQRQRLTIARAMLKDAPLVLLDEATSSLDVEAEYEVHLALNRLLEGRTAVIVAHRLTTLRHTDRILVIDDGRIVEEGSQEQLLAMRGRFYALYQTQTQDYN